MKAGTPSHGRLENLHTRATNGQEHQLVLAVSERFNTLAGFQFLTRTHRLSAHLSCGSVDLLLI